MVLQCQHLTVDKNIVDVIITNSIGIRSSISFGASLLDINTADVINTDITTLLLFSESLLHVPHGY